MALVLCVAALTGACTDGSKDDETVYEIVDPTTTAAPTSADVVEPDAAPSTPSPLEVKVPGADPARLTLLAVEPRTGDLLETSFTLQPSPQARPRPLWIAVQCLGRGDLVVRVRPDGPSQTIDCDPATNEGLVKNITSVNDVSFGGVTASTVDVTAPSWVTWALRIEQEQ